MPTSRKSVSRHQALCLLSQDSMDSTCFFHDQALGPDPTVPGGGREELPTEDPQVGARPCPTCPLGACKGRCKCTTHIRGITANTH